MCGRFEQYLAKRGQYWSLDEPQRRHNICPTQLVGTIDAEGYKERSWSLIPPWAPEPKLKYSTFNARAETVAEKSTFRNAWRKSQRCVVPSNGYFEWTGERGNRQCHYIQPTGDEPLQFGGLWEAWERDGHRVDSFTIITTPAHGEISWLHHRMPLMLEPGEVDTWLTGSPEEAAAIMADRPAPTVTIREVDGPKSIQ